MNATRPRRSFSRETQWADLRREHVVRGVSIKELARRYGIDPNTVRRALRSADPPRYEREQPPAKLHPFSAARKEIGPQLDPSHGGHTPAKNPRIGQFAGSLSRVSEGTRTPDRLDHNQTVRVEPSG